MAKKVLLISLGALVLAAGFAVVAALTKRSGFSPSISQNLFPAASPKTTQRFIASGQVLGAKRESNSLTVKFDSPPMFRGKTQDVEIGCPTSESFVNTITINIKAKKSPVYTAPQPTSKLLFEIADPTKKDKDVITGNCASPSCTIIDTGCLLTRTIYIR